MEQLSSGTLLITVRGKVENIANHNLVLKTFTHILLVKSSLRSTLTCMKWGKDSKRLWPTAQSTRHAQWIAEIHLIPDWAPSPTNLLPSVFFISVDVNSILPVTQAKNLVVILDFSVFPCSILHNCIFSVRPESDLWTPTTLSTHQHLTPGLCRQYLSSRPLLLSLTTLHQSLSWAEQPQSFF